MYAVEAHSARFFTHRMNSTDLLGGFGPTGKRIDAGAQFCVLITRCDASTSSVFTCAGVSSLGCGWVCVATSGRYDVVAPYPLAKAGAARVAEKSNAEEAVLMMVSNSR